MSPTRNHILSIDSINIQFTYYIKIKFIRFSEPPRRGSIHVMNPDPYQGLWGGNKCRESISEVKGRECKCSEKGDCEATKKYIEQLEETIRFVKKLIHLHPFIL